MLLLGAGHSAQIPLGTALTMWDPQPTLPNLQFPSRQWRRPRGVRLESPHRPCLEQTAGVDQPLSKSSSTAKLARSAES